MICSLSDLKNKEIIDVKTGEKLGFVDDVEMDIESARVLALIVFGRPRFFGLFGREKDLIIQCKEIMIIGEDVILISPENLEKEEYSPKNKRMYFENS